MKQKEHTNNWSGGILLLSFLLMLFVFSTNDNDQTTADNSTVIECEYPVIHPAITIDPANISNHADAINEKDAAYISNSIVSGLRFFENQTNIQINLAQLRFRNHKHNIVSSQLIHLFATRKYYPPIS